jgi:hypothetical protein
VLAAVLPGAEPQEYQVNMVFARLRNDRIDSGIVELSRLVLEFLPVDGYLERVGVQVFNRRPDFG